jgi:hypothetical protein
LLHLTVHRVEPGDVEVEIESSIEEVIRRGEQRRLIFHGANVTDVQQSRAFRAWARRRRRPPIERHSQWHELRREAARGGKLPHLHRRHRDPSRSREGDSQGKAPSPGGPSSVSDVRQGDKLAARTVNHQRQAVTPCEERPVEAASSEKGVHHIERTLLVFCRQPREQAPPPSLPPTDIVDGRAKQRPVRRVSFLVEREYVYFMSGRQPFYQPQQARDDAVDSSAIHTTWYYQGELHRCSANVS